MAIESLTSADGPANIEPALSDLAANIQMQASRIKSLTEAIDEALSHGEGTGVSHALNYVDLIKEAAERARAYGEQVEIYEMRSRGNR